MLTVERIQLKTNTVFKNYLKKQFSVEMKFAPKETTLNQLYLKGQYSADGKVFGCYFCTDGCITFTEGMILEASFSNVIFYICKCKWVPAYHLCMQMIDLHLHIKHRSSLGMILQMDRYSVNYIYSKKCKLKSL